MKQLGELNREELRQVCLAQAERIEQLTNDVAKWRRRESVIRHLVADMEITARPRRVFGPDIGGLEQETETDVAAVN